jgi:CRISPR/Cas system CSM-associated protein Csm3 (group 7 of RAMP superfamily)
MTTMAGSATVRAAEEHPPVRYVSFIRSFLRFTEPAAVTVPGFPGRDDQTPWGRERAHLLLDTDPWGRPHLPGTSLAGALRDHVRRAEGEPVADAWFGHLVDPGTGNPAEVDARASLLWVLGTRPADSSGDELATVATEIRASTAISRDRGAAAANTLRVEELLPVGSRFEVFLRWDDPPPDEIERLLAVLASWRPLIGHGTSRGRGRCVIEDIHHGGLRLDQPDGLYRWLTCSGPELARQVAADPVKAKAAGEEPQAILRVDTKIIGPLRVGSGEPPQATGDEGQKVTPLFHVGGRYVIPGTGLKGLLRSRAEFILRSVGLAPSPCEDQRCRTCWTCRVFGHAGGHDTTSQAVGARAAVRFPDACIDDPVAVTRQHVAIDRFTGGAHRGLLYTVDALEGGTFTITVEPLGAEVPQSLLTEFRAIMRLVLEDLSDGLAGIGAGVTRGYGSVSADLGRAEAGGDLPTLPAAREVLAKMVTASAQGGHA